MKFFISVTQIKNKINVRGQVLLFFFTFSLIINAQTYEPIYKDIYPFLNRLAQKGIIQLDDQIKPLSRKYIAQKLIKLDFLKSKLTGLEREELQSLKRVLYRNEFRQNIPV